MSGKDYRGLRIFKVSTTTGLHPMGQINRQTAASVWIGASRYSINAKTGSVTPVPRDCWSTSYYVLEGSPAHEAAVKQYDAEKAVRERVQRYNERTAQVVDLLRRITATRDVARLDAAIAALTALLPPETTS